MVKILLYQLFIFFLLMPGVGAFAGDEAGEVPEQVTAGHWSCKAVSELARKYNAEKQLPESVVIGGKTCTRGEVATCLLSVIDKVVEKCKVEGPDAVPKEDLEEIARLHEALETELSKSEGYVSRREAIQSILARPEAEQPPFLLKAGVKGFVRGEGAGNFSLRDFGFAQGHAQGRFLYRAQPYAYWHPTDYLDLHVEGQGYGFSGSNQGSGKFSLYQGFVEARFPGSNLLALKAGRQEFSYGSAFMLGPNSYYDGLSFDAARLRVKPFPALSVDMLGGWYAHPFDNGLEGDLEGVYAAYTFGEGYSAEAYFFRDTGALDHRFADRLLIWGLRGTARLGPINVELEPVYESGSGGISAYGGHVDLAVELDPFGHDLNVFAGYAMGSGSRDAASGIRSDKEFRNPNNDTSLVGDMNVVGDLSGINVGEHHASGLHDFTAGFGVDIAEGLNFSATGHYFLAGSVEPGFSRDIGLETDFTLTYNITESLSVIVGYDHFFTKGFFYGATGSRADIDYGYAMLQFDIAKAIPKKP